MHRLIASIFAVMVTFAASSALASDAYSALVNEAIAAQTSGDFERAHELFSQAHELSPSARTLRGMGITSYQLGKYRRAVHELDAALSHSVRPLDAELRDSVVALRARASAAIALLRPVIKPSAAHAALFVDGEAHTPPPLVIPLDPGMHALRAVAEGYRDHEQMVMLAPGSETNVQIVLDALPLAAPSLPSSEPRAEAPVPSEPEAASRTSAEPAARRRRRRAGIALLAAGVGLGATAGALWATAVSRGRTIERECEKVEIDCRSDDVFDGLVREHPYEPLVNATTALVAVSIAAGVTSGALFIWNASERRRAVQVGIFPYGGFLRTSF